jgi:hypothetical protein
VVTQVPKLKVVVAQVALGLKIICPFGTLYVKFPAADVMVIFEFWKKIVPPVDGIPLALKLALNQM